MFKVNRSGVFIVNFEHISSLFLFFFSIIILITKIYKTKKYCSHQALFYISSTREKEKK